MQGPWLQQVARGTGSPACTGSKRREAGASAARHVQAEVGLAAARQRLHDVPAQRGQQKPVVRLRARAPARRCEACGALSRPAALPSAHGRGARPRGACGACSAVVLLLAAARGRARARLRRGRMPA